MSTPLSEQQLAEYRRITEATTAGEWLVADGDTGRPVIYVERDCDGGVGALPLWAARAATEADAQFVAKAPRWMSALLADNARLRAERNQFADRVDTLTSVAKGNQAHVRSLMGDLAERDRRIAELEAERRSASEALAEAADEVENLLAEHESGATSCHAFGAALAQMYGRWRTGDAEPGAQSSPVFVCAFDDNGQPVQGGAQ